MMMLTQVVIGKRVLLAEGITKRLIYLTSDCDHLIRSWFMMMSSRRQKTGFNILRQCAPLKGSPASAITIGLLVKRQPSCADIVVNFSFSVDGIVLIRFDRPSKEGDREGVPLSVAIGWGFLCHGYYKIFSLPCFPHFYQFCLTGTSQDSTTHFLHPICLSVCLGSLV